MKWIIIILLCALSAGCTMAPLPGASLKPVSRDSDGNYQYRLAASDSVSIFVWRNQELSGDYVIRPDGKLNMALTQPIMAEGLTTTELEIKLEELLSDMIKNPNVSVLVRQASGGFHEKVRIVGTASQPFAATYQKGMTVLDLITISGGLSPYAAGNRAILVRTHYGKVYRYTLRLDDLINNADLSANIALQPGDVIRIPQAWF